jgi:hypothetical protein
MSLWHMAFGSHARPKNLRFPFGAILPFQHDLSIPTVINKWSLYETV